MSNSNIIIIVLDAGRFDYLSCYRFPQKLASNIDKFVVEGILFENATTVPLHASLFTGLYPDQHLANRNTLNY